MTKIVLAECDCVFISFREENAEQNWRELLKQRSDAKRVHGVKGFDRAHQMAANTSDSDWVVTVDGDTRVYPELWELELETQSPNALHNFASYNPINGLVYGNGSVKTWPKHVLANVASHKQGVDFAQDLEIYATGLQMGEHDINFSKAQAITSGYREGAKLPLALVEKPGIFDLNNSGHFFLHRWLTVGSHAKNGIWGILGARLGLIDTFEKQEMSRMLLLDNDKLRAYLSGYLMNSEGFARQQCLETTSKITAILSVDVPLHDAKISEQLASEPGVIPRVGFVGRPLGQGFTQRG